MVGLGVVVACIIMLSSRLEQHMCNNIQMMIRSNDMILTRLARVTDPSLQPPEPTVGVVLERRHTPRHGALARMSGNSGETKPSDLPRRRMEDLLSA